MSAVVPKTLRERTTDWRAGFRLGDGCSIKHGFAFKGIYMTIDGDVDLPIVVNIVNFQYTGGFRFESTKVQRYTGSFPGEYMLQPDDILLVMTCQTPKGEILGIPGRIPKDSRTYLHNQRLGLVQVHDPEALDPAFLYYLFLSSSFNAHLYGTSTGAKILHTSPSRIEDYRFDCPPLKVQRQIAGILSAYDDLIENNTRRIKILEEMAQALYREWFVHFRFPGHEHVPMVDSPLGLIPEGWEIQELGEIAEVNARSIRASGAPDEINYIDISSVSPGRIDNIERLNFRDAPSRARRVAQDGDIIWSTVRPNRRSFALILQPPPDLVVSTGFAVISPKSVPYTYLYHALTTDDFVGYLTNRATGSAYPAVIANDFNRARILMPPTCLLDHFDRASVDLLNYAQILDSKQGTLRQTRDLLLPKLVSGELGIPSVVEPSS